MKKFQSHHSVSILLQVIGILVNGVLGMGLEMIGLSIVNLKNKETLISLLKKFVFVVVSQILIDLIFGNNSMIVEMIFLYLEKMSVVIIAMIKILIGLLFLSFLQENALNKKSKSAFSFYFSFLKIILALKKLTVCLFIIVYQLVPDSQDDLKSNVVNLRIMNF